MRVLCRKFCPHELSGIEGNDGEHLIDASTEEDELELEDEAMATVANAAVEMGMQQSDLKAELKDISAERNMEHDVSLQPGEPAAGVVEKVGSLLSDSKKFDMEMTGGYMPQTAGEVTN